MIAERMLVDASPTTLPPGPSVGPARQVAAWIFRPEALMERGRRERGDVFTLHLPLGPIVVVADPALVKDVFTGDPDVLRAGEGNRPLEPVVGPDSLLLLDGPRHLRRRRLVLPPFHGERLKTYENDMAALTLESLATWPRDRPFALEPHLRAITLAIIVRVVFGIEDDERAARMQALIPELVPDGGWSSLLLLPALRRDLGPRSPWRRFLAARAAVDALLHEEIAKHRADPNLAARTDILSLLLQARDEDGAPLTDEELRDELMTLLLAGHETTASALAWAFTLLVHARPDALERARDDDAYLDAVATETLRLEPPLPMAVRRGAEPVAVGGHDLPAGTRIAPCIYLIHRREDLYDAPRAFRPERFLDGKAETYAWLPFGGGIRRCVGAAFAQLELRTVLRTVLDALDVRAPDAGGRPERTRRRAIVLAPDRGARVVVRTRSRSATATATTAATRPGAAPPPRAASAGS
ncbi:MAG TPA: cytochrome P450 [Baekduia sp.]|uniref:cytochrome P450 n=1 Tax=Baekduia sp. TaxID=2600305 RepID=UPI002D764D5E|nr:cytochrome P450 [Baekduia sp.]HET6506693.1 cytochrome P450 [Baekduia sp.]